MKTQQFRDLLVWQRAMILAKDIYAVTNRFPRAEIFRLTSQVRRAAVSTPAILQKGTAGPLTKVLRFSWDKLVGRYMNLRLSWNLPSTSNMLRRALTHG